MFWFPVGLVASAAARKLKPKPHFPSNPAPPIPSTHRMVPLPPRQRPPHIHQPLRAHHMQPPAVRGGALVVRLDVPRLEVEGVGAGRRGRGGRAAAGVRGRRVGGLSAGGRGLLLGGGGVRWWGRGQECCCCCCCYCCCAGQVGGCCAVLRWSRLVVAAALVWAVVRDAGAIVCGLRHESVQVERAAAASEILSRHAAVDGPCVLLQRIAAVAAPAHVSSGGGWQGTAREREVVERGFQQRHIVTAAPGRGV